MEITEYVKALGAAATAWKGTDLLKEIYGDAFKPGVEQVGKALGGVLGLGNTVLYPVHLANARAKVALEANLDRYRARLEKEPIDKVTEVPPEVGVPVAEKLAYVSDEALANLYIELLAKASLRDTAGLAHPSFVNLINSLSPDEAGFLSTWVNSLGEISVQPMASSPANPLARFIGDIALEGRLGEGLIYPKNIGVYICNLEGLGVLSSSTDRQLTKPGAYDALEGLVRKTCAHRLDQGEVMTFKRGLVQVTPYGDMFMAACGVKQRS
jgi:hypothetical protein